MRRKFEKNEKEKIEEIPGRKRTLNLSKEWEEQYIAKAERREKEFFGETDPEKYDESEEETETAYQELVDSLREKGIYHEEEPKILSLYEENRPGGEEPDLSKRRRRRAAGEQQKIAGKKRRYRSIRLGKIAGIALVCCACVFAASMTSEANRSYFVNNIRIWSGIDTKTVVDNDETNETATTEEEVAFAEIEKTLGIDMPTFYYRPYGLEFLDYEVDETVSIARLEYLYEEKVIILLIDQQSEDRASNINSAHGEKTETVITVSDGIKVTIEKIQDVQDKEPSYTAQWEREDVFYYLSGKMELEELRQIIENMVY
mgnify:CR=1 FL=1